MALHLGACMLVFSLIDKRVAFLGLQVKGWALAIICAWAKWQFKVPSLPRVIGHLFVYKEYPVTILGCPQVHIVPGNPMTHLCTIMCSICKEITLLSLPGKDSLGLLEKSIQLTLNLGLKRNNVGSFSVVEPWTSSLHSLWSLSGHWNLPYKPTFVLWTCKRHLTILSQVLWSDSKK